MAADRPVRAGLGVWRSFEQLDWPTQQDMLHAAAVALHLAEIGEITARGTLGPLLTAEPHQPVYDGDDLPYRLRHAREQLDAMTATARTDREAARRLLGWATLSSPTGPFSDRVRRILIDGGIPAEFLVPADTAEAVR